MAISLKREKPQVQGRGYTEFDARKLALELGGVAVAAKWDAGSQSWEFFGNVGTVGKPWIVVLPLATGYRGKTQYVTLADNQSPVKTSAEVLATYREM